MDKLHTTSHVLHCNIVTLRAVQNKAEQSLMIWHPSQVAAERAQFSHNAQSIIQELEFERNQVQLITHRLEAVVEMVRGLWLTSLQEKSMQFRSPHFRFVTLSIYAAPIIWKR